MGEDRRGFGGEQAGCAQEARWEDPAEVPWRTTEEKGKGLVIFTRFSDRSRMCVEAALDEARMLGHDSLGDEDLLLGILRADDGIAAEALSSLGVTLEGSREESEEMLSGALASIGISLEEVRREAGDAFEFRIPDKRRIPISPWAKKALVEARKEMRRLGDNHLGTEHVLLGILGNADGTAVRMLSRMGVSPEMLEERLFELRGRAAG
jgi:ATP-dependent Clp protease ATP-binding subunit ClpC